MNQTKYRKAAIALGKIPGMERSPWYLQETNLVHPEGASQEEADDRMRRIMVDNEFLGGQIKINESEGVVLYQAPHLKRYPWLLVDDFSDWSAAKIASNVWRNLPFESRKKAEEFALTGCDPFDSNLELVQFIIEAHKNNPAAVIAALPKE